MTRPSTVAALAAIVCAPALVAFAQGQMPGFSLALWYLAALVVLGTGLHLLSGLLSRYAGEVTERERPEPTPDDPDPAHLSTDPSATASADTQSGGQSD